MCIPMGLSSALRRNTPRSTIFIRILKVSFPSRLYNATDYSVPSSFNNCLPLQLNTRDHLLLFLFNSSLPHCSQPPAQHQTLHSGHHPQLPGWMEPAQHVQGSWSAPALRHLLSGHLLRCSSLHTIPAQAIPGQDYIEQHGYTSQGPCSKNTFLS